MNVVFDSDILSCIAKTRRFEFIATVFPACTFLVPGRVYEELVRAKKAGYEFVDYVLNLIDNSQVVMPSLSEEENVKIRELEGTNLHFGEIEAIVLSRRKDTILLSNDANVKKKAKELGVEVFNLEDVISFAIETGVLSNFKDALNLINDIESNDKIKIRNKQHLLEKLKLDA